MAKAQTLSELADNIVERQLTLRDQAAIERKEMSGINKKIHAFGGEAMLFDHISQGKTTDSVIKSLDISIGGFYKWIENLFKTWTEFMKYYSDSCVTAEQTTTCRA